MVSWRFYLTKLLKANDKPMQQYEVILGGYCNVAVCFLGLVGNLLSLAVLFRKEMKQKNNTFNNLLIGEWKGNRDWFEWRKRNDVKVATYRPCIGPNQKNKPNLDLYLVWRYTICHFPIVVSYLCIGQNQKNQPDLVLYLVGRSKIFVSVATLAIPVCNHQNHPVISAFLKKMTPALGPLRVLWTVEVTTSQSSKGDGASPAATRPDTWAMSAIRSEPGAKFEISYPRRSREVHLGGVLILFCDCNELPYGWTNLSETFRVCRGQ